MRKLCKTENFVSNPKNYLIFLKSVVLDSGLPREGWGFNHPPPEIRKALQNRAKLNPIVKTVKNPEFRTPTPQDVRKKRQ